MDVILLLPMLAQIFEPMAQIANPKMSPGKWTGVLFVFSVIEHTLVVVKIKWHIILYILLLILLR